MDSREFREGLEGALKSSFSSPSRFALTVAAASASYVLLILSGFPDYSWQLLSASVFYVDDALIALTGNTLKTAGALGILTTVIYSLLVGTAITNFVLSLSLESWSGYTNLGAAMPGFLATGCAGCGAGLLGFLGLGGALAMMPFQGNGIRLGGIALLLYFIAKTGDPGKCEVSA